MRQDSFRAKCIYVAVMLRRMIEAILNKDAMDDKVIHSIPKLSAPFFPLGSKRSCHILTMQCYQFNQWISGLSRFFKRI